ncbi:hypothetical protein BN2476_40006 [Paraburkholderia piptadeniae]|uniref:Uncharacterized protein n=1 Tax=Paraburkholderia piptadeniae TaxID=1701573 RepID=A0A1N7RJY4_9BURK|nr:hypothetical protein BN2476_40006 [Paraburkholderia piptadeniae]
MASSFHGISLCGCNSRLSPGFRGSITCGSIRAAAPGIGDRPSVWARRRKLRDCVWSAAAPEHQLMDQLSFDWASAVTLRSRFYHAVTFWPGSIDPVS